MSASYSNLRVDKTVSASSVFNTQTRHILVDPLGQLVPVVNGAGHIMADDVVELERIRPLLFHIIDFELQIWWGPWEALMTGTG